MTAPVWFMETLHAYRLACVFEAIHYRQFSDVRSLVRFVEFVSVAPSIRQAYARGGCPTYAVYAAFEAFQAARSLPVFDPLEPSPDPGATRH